MSGYILLSENALRYIKRSFTDNKISTIEESVTIIQINYVVSY